MSKKITPLAINITSTRLEFCTIKQHTPLVLNFPQTAISDMEIVNRDELKNAMQNFFSEHQIHAQPVVLILNESMYYFKDFTGNVPPQNDEIQKYLDLVPFSTVSFRVYKLPTSFRLVVINRDFYETFKNILQSLGFSIVSVVPSFIVTGSATSTAFSAQTCILINHKIDTILENSFGGQEESLPPVATGRQFIASHQTPVAIIAVFIILACPLIFYLYFQKEKKEAVALRRAQTATKIVPVIKPTISPTPTVSQFSNLNLGQYTVQLLNASGNPDLSASLSSKLNETGFTQLSTGNFPKTNSIQIIYRPSIPITVRDLIKSLLPSSSRPVVVKESTTSQFDISITLGKLN